MDEVEAKEGQQIYCFSELAYDQNVKGGRIKWIQTENR